MAKRTSPFSPEVRARAVRMVLEHQGEHASQRRRSARSRPRSAARRETLRNWVRQAERDRGLRSGPTSHIDIAEVRTEQGKLHRIIAIDRASTYAFVELA